MENKAGCKLALGLEMENMIYLTEVLTKVVKQNSTAHDIQKFVNSHKKRGR